MLGAQELLMAELDLPSNAQRPVGSQTLPAASLTRATFLRKWAEELISLHDWQQTSEVELDYKMVSSYKQNPTSPF